MVPMGHADIVTKEYMSNNDVFADAFNYLIYHGRKVIAPASLHAIDTAETAVVYLNEEDPGTVQKYRDLLKSAVLMTGDKISYLLLGIENQEDIHYAMPVRNMVYDALLYERQVRETAEQHHQAKDWKEKTRGEFLSGFYKEDRLKPVVTMVVSFSPDKWDGPLSLHEMMEECDPEIMGFVQDYKIHLIEPASVSEEDFSKFSTDLGAVMKFIKYSRDKVRMEEILQTDSAYRELRTSAAQVLNTCTKIGLEIDEKSEVMDMCQAIQEMQKEAVDKAIDKAEETTLLKTAKSLMKTLHMTADQALTAMEVSDADRELLMPML